MEKRILLMYVSLNSGHLRASLGIEQAVRHLSPEAHLANVNVLHYTHPWVEQFVKKTYFGLLRTCPRLWNYLYDRPSVVKKTQGLRGLIYKTNARKLKSLLEEFQPGVVVCTQAFPCGMVAEYKERSGLRLPLVGVLTDYHPHAYWIHDQVDYYVVPSEKAKDRLRGYGVAEERILLYGIPVEIRFAVPKNRSEIFQKLALEPTVPTVLVMGGSYGFGPIAELVRELDKLTSPVQLLVVCGKNRKLFERLSERSVSFKHPIRIYGFADNVDELMEIATCLVTKPGGVSTSEALTKGLPMVILNPLGGQENANAEFLVNEGIAMKAEDPKEVKDLVKELLASPEKLQALRRSARKQGRPESALQLARHLLSLA